MDATTPQQPNDPSKAVLDSAQTQGLYERTKASISKAKAALERARAKGEAGADDLEAKETF